VSKLEVFLMFCGAVGLLFGFVAAIAFAIGLALALAEVFP
jgi:hypothetical protein